MGARVKHLVAEGLTKRQGQRVIFARDMLDTLRRRELDAVAARVGFEHLAWRIIQPREGDPIAGPYRQRFNLASGRFTLIDDGFGFSLVPWSPSLERHLGRQSVGDRAVQGTELNGVPEEHVVRPLGDPAPVHAAMRASRQLSAHILPKADAIHSVPKPKADQRPGRALTHPRMKPTKRGRQGYVGCGA